MSAARMKFDAREQRIAATISILRKAKCEKGWPNRKDCFHNDANPGEWCWPCHVRWAHRHDARRFVRPMDDLA